MLVNYAQCPVKYMSRMLIYRSEECRKRRKSDSFDNNHHCHSYFNGLKCYSYILIYVFIVAAIMFLSLPTTIAMHIQSNHHGNEISVTKKSDPDNLRYEPATMTMTTTAALATTTLSSKKLTANNENENQLKAFKGNTQFMCNCSNGKIPNIQMENCMQICAKHDKAKMIQSKSMRITNDRHHYNDRMRDLTKNSFDRSVTINESTQQHNDVSIIRMQSTERAINCSRIPLKFTTIQGVSQKSVNSNSQNEINENAKFNTTTTIIDLPSPPTNLYERFYAVKHQINLKNILLHTKQHSNEIHDEHNDDKIDDIMVSKQNSNHFNYKRNVKRTLRSTSGKMQPNQIEIKKNFEYQKSYQQPSTSADVTKIPFYIKQTMNEFFDSTDEDKSEGGVKESNGTVFDANRTTVSIISSKYL